MNSRGLCAYCDSVTESVCKDCKTFYCSVECMVGHAYAHIPYCNKLAPVRENASPRKPMPEDYSFDPNEPLGFRSRFLIDSEKFDKSRTYSQEPHFEVNESGYSGRGHRSRGNHNESTRSRGRSQNKGRGPQNSRGGYAPNAELSSNSEREPSRPQSNYSGQSRPRGRGGARIVNQEASHAVDEDVQQAFDSSSSSGREHGRPMSGQPRTRGRGGARRFNQDAPLAFDEVCNSSSGSGRELRSNQPGQSRPRGNAGVSGRGGAKRLNQKAVRALDENASGFSPSSEPGRPRSNQSGQSRPRGNEGLNKSDRMRRFDQKSQLAVAKDVKQVVPLWHENGGYWILPHEKFQSWQNIQDKLKECAAKFHPITPKVHTLCAALYDGIWYRARVVSLAPLEVLYIDYGNRSTCKESDLKKLPQDLADVAPMIRFVKVKNEDTLNLEKSTNVRFIGDDLIELAIRGNTPRSQKSEPYSKKIEEKERQSQLGDLKDVPPANKPVGKAISLSNKVSNPPDLLTTCAKSSKPAEPALPFTSILESLQVGDELTCIINKIIGKEMIVTVIPDLHLDTVSKVSGIDAGDSKPIKAAVGTVAAVKYHGNELAYKNWARGYIITKTTGTSTVALIDYGCVLQVDDVYPLGDTTNDVSSLACVLKIEIAMPGLTTGSELILSAVQKAECGWLCEIATDGRESTSATLKPWKPFTKVAPLPKMVSGVEVVITAPLGISRLFFNINEEAHMETYACIQQEASVKAMESPALIDLPAIGEIVAAKSNDDDFFYRCRIIGHYSEQDCNVQFLDFGNTQKTSVSDLKHIPDKLCSPPAAAFYATLFGVPDISCPEAVLEIQAAVADNTVFVMTFDGKLEDGVILKNKDTGANFNSVLKKLAEKAPVTNPVSIVAPEDDLIICKAPVGPNVKLFVIHVDRAEMLTEGRFFCATEGPEFLFASDELNLILNKYCSELPPERYRPRRNEICAALYEDEWARGLCMKEEDPIQIFFIDYGNKIIADTKNIRPLVQELKTPVAAAVECYIRDFKMANTEEKRNKISDVMESLTQKQISVTVSVRDNVSYFISDIPIVDSILKS